MELPALLYDINDSSKALHMPAWTLRGQIRAGNINVTRLGKRIMLNTNEIERIAREGLPSLGVKSNAEPAEPPAHAIEAR
jgi:hypothetical protein